MPRSLDVVHLIHSGAIGGGPRVVLDLVTRVNARHTVIVPDDGPLLRDAADHATGVTRLPFAGKYSFCASIPMLLPAFRLADIVHLHGQFAGFYGSMAARVAGVPVVYTAHFPSFLADANWHNRLRNYTAESLTCKLASMTVACSETNRLEYLERRLIEPSRIITIYNGVSLRSGHGEPHAIRAELNVDEEAPIVLAMGRLTDQKGFDVLMGAVPRVLDAIPSTRFIVAGDGERRPALERQAAHLGVTHAVRFLGFRRDTSDLLALASIVAAPSRYESSGLVIMEAMMAGRAVLASDLPVFQEAIDQGRTGVLVPLDANQLASSLVGLLRDGAMRSCLGRQAAATARERFGADRMAAEYERLYRRLANGQT